MTAESRAPSREEICIIRVRRPSCTAWTFGVPAPAWLLRRGIIGAKRQMSAAGSGETTRRRATADIRGQASALPRVVAEMKRLPGCRAGLNREAAEPIDFSAAAEFLPLPGCWFLPLPGCRIERLSAWARSSRAPAISFSMPEKPPPRLSCWICGRGRPCPSPRPCASATEGRAMTHAASTARTSFRTITLQTVRHPFIKEGVSHFAS